MKQTITLLFLFALSIAAWSDVFTDMAVVKCNGEENAPAQSYPHRYRVESLNDAFIMSDFSNQKIISRKIIKNKSIIVVDCLSNTLRTLPSDDDLVSSWIVNTNNSSVRKWAMELKNETDAILSAEKTVYTAISDKRLGVPIISTDDIVENRIGDCKEHSILLTALLRAAGIPARAVVGLRFIEQFQGKRNVFVYHMWCEAYIDKVWVLADASFPGNHPESKYIALAYHSLKTETPLEYLEVISTVKELSIECIK